MAAMSGARLGKKVGHPEAIGDQIEWVLLAPTPPAIYTDVESCPIVDGRRHRRRRFNS
jgi:hypothetical protein